MNRRHGLFLAVAIGLAAIAGTYAALQTTDLGAQAATLSEKEIAAADIRLDKQEAALRRAARKRPPRLPKLPARASGGLAVASSGPAAGAATVASTPAPAPSGGSFSSGPSGNSGPGSWDDHDDDHHHEDDFDDDDHSGHGGGGDDDFDDDHSGHGGGDDD
jgi:hypothetical protein